MILKNHRTTKYRHSYFSNSRNANDELKCLIGRVQDKVKIVKYLPQVPNTINFDSKIEDFDGLLMISSATGIIKIPSRICKRLIDILGSLVGLLLLIPITIFVYVKNRSEGDKDPIFFTQERIGKMAKHLRYTSLEQWFLMQNKF